MSVLKDAIFRHSSHNGLDILPVNGFIESLDRGNCSGWSGSISVQLLRLTA